MTKNNFIWRIASLAVLLLLGPGFALAAGIDTAYRYAYSEKLGVIDFTTVRVDDATLTGYALAGTERIDFATPDFSVKNDGQGRLSGFASSAKYGIINFNGVTIDKDGYFQGVADGGILSGRLIFDCARNIYCPEGLTYKLRTDWVPAQAAATPVAAASTPVAVGGYKPVTVVASATPVAAASAPADPVSYKSCDKINDYVSYIKCISDIDAQRSGNKVVVTNDLLSGDPKDFSVLINGGAGIAPSRQVKLSIKASPASVQMAIAADNQVASPAKEALAAEKSYELADIENVPQTVYIKFYDKDGKPLYIASAAVTYSKPKLDAAQEAKAAVIFTKLYGRQPQTTVNDQAALGVIALGVDKALVRDLTKEAAALKQFQKVYKKNPTGEEWNWVKALAYYNNQTIAATETVAPAVISEVNVDCKPKKALSLALTLDSQGEEVKQLQASLSCMGYLAGSGYTSGIFDKPTEDAVKAFQEKNKLKCADGTFCGFVGPSSRKVLNSGKATPVKQAVEAVPAVVKQVNVFKRNLTVKMSGDDVKALQTLLASDGTYAGKVTGTFDDATEKAVMKYQEKNNLKCADGTYCGYIGPATRTKLNASQAQ
ncbi:MAG: peptidoglycan-binding protein [Candidatus Falkowbacteria bacterium]